MSPASGFASMMCRVAPVLVSPWRTAQLIGTRPLYLGSKEPCIFKAAILAISKICCEIMNR